MTNTWKAAQNGLGNVGGIAALMLASLWLGACGFVQAANIQVAGSVQRGSDGLLPHQIHIALGDQPSEMIILWATEDYTAKPPIVHYGIDKTLTSSMNGTSAYFNIGNSEGLHYYHRVKLIGLLPNMVYYYSVDTAGQRGPVKQFRTMKNDQHWSSEFVIYGDLGRSGGAPCLRRLKYEASTGRYTAFIHVGDFAYDFHDENGKIGDYFMTRIESIASSVPYMTCPGNHELYFNFAHYRYRFSMPHSDWPMREDKLWYSFDVANIHFISYSSEVFFTNGGKYAKTQYDWLVNDLTEANKKENREKRPWIIAFGHRPMYCSNIDRDDCTKEKSLVREGLEELFYKQGVDMIVQGHEHSYERLFPMFNGSVSACHYVNPRAPVHIVTGAAGCNEFSGLCADVILKPKGVWSAFRVWLPGLNSYGRLKVYNNTHLYFEQVIGWNGQVMDGFWLVQNDHGMFPEPSDRRPEDKITSCV